MDKNQILDYLMRIAHQPFLVFANAVDEKMDNTFEALKLLAIEDNVTAGRISEFLDIKPSSVTQIIKKLEDAGTAVREKSEEDSRVTFVKITEKGRESLKTHSAIGSELKDALFKGISDEDIEKLGETLEQMVKNVSSDQFRNQLEEAFSNNKNWERFGKMSSRFDRAREQMLRHSDHIKGFGHHHGLDRHFGPDFDNWKKGR